MRYLLPLLGVAVVLFIGCTSPVKVAAPNVQVAAVDTGKTLRLTWAAVTDAQGYYVYLDTGSKITLASTVTTYDVTYPNKTISVTAYNSSGESDKATTTTTTISSTITVDNVAGSGANHAFYFNTSGTALAIPLTDVSDMDFVLDTTNGGTELRSPDQYSPPYNSKDNSSATTTTSFANYDIAEAPGGYLTARPILDGNVMALWMDPTNNGWTTDDHYAKMQVAIPTGSNTATLTLAYQTIGGLRWVLSD